MLEFFLGLIISMLVGAVVGLIPFFVGRHMGKPGLGRLGWLCCTIGGLLFLSVLVAVGFVVAIIVCRNDYYFPQPARRTPAAPRANVQSSGTTLGVKCLAGPLKGQTYRLCGEGILIGRDHDCAIRFASETPGVSRHHCSLRWQQGALMLTDLNSAYGTYLADGRKLPPQYPVQLSAGSRFYLASTEHLFQIVIVA